MENKLMELKLSYEKFKKMKFPKNNLDNDSTLFAELVFLDSGIAGLILSKLDGEEKKVDLSKDLDNLYEEAKMFTPKNDEEETDLKYFFEYLKALKKLNNLFISF